MSDYLRDVTIMIVEDQSFSANLMRRMLRVLGATDVHVFDNGEDAWNYFKANPIDLVITDWEMAPVDGIELTKLIRQDESSDNPFVPIIMVTAYREKEHVIKARDIGVTEYVVKPVSPKGLFSRIEVVIEKPRKFVRIKGFFGPDRRRINKEYSGEDRRKKKLDEKTIDENTADNPSDDTEKNTSPE